MIFVSDIKKNILKKLKNENIFWSYNPAKINIKNISDEVLIQKTLTHLDIEDIDLLFYYYKYDFIKKVWREQMAIQGDYMRSLNRFLAWYYFDIKKPDRYLKTIETKHFKQYD